MSSKLLLLITLILVVWPPKGNCFYASRAFRSTPNSIRMSDENMPLWKERVEFVDLSSQILPPSSTARSLPLFLLGGTFFPEGVTVLNVFEMKYRTMMFDCANADDIFGYYYTDAQTGRIAQVGTMCKIVDRRLEEDGRQIIQIQGIGRCRVRKIIKTLPYILAEVEPFVMDDPPAGGEAAAVKLEKEVWDALKYYMRLMKSYEPNKGMVVTQSAKKNRPTRLNEMDATRRTQLSFSLANMISMSQPSESQQLLQTQSIMKRLTAEKVILTQAAEGISEQLVQMNILTADRRDGIKMNSMSLDDDSDILPPDLVQKVVETEKDEWDISNLE